MSPLTSERNHQIGKLFFYGPLGISLVMMIVAINQAVLGYVQMNEAKQERISASQALEEAENAKLIANSTATEMQTLYRQAENEVTEIKRIVSEAQSALDNIEIFNEFSLTLIKARNDDAQSFDYIKAWAEDETHPFHAEAKAGGLPLVCC